MNRKLGSKEPKNRQKLNYARGPMIGILDSGFGGLTVMRHIRVLLPYEEIVYLGDTAHLPYGEKSPKTISQYCVENSAFLLDKGIRVLVIACHSACSAALDVMRAQFPIPIIGIIEHGLEALSPSAQCIAILGTRATINAALYEKRIRARCPQADILPIACPLFVPLVEEGYCDHPIAALVVKEYLHPLKEKALDAVVLGCTHYPLLASAISRELAQLPLIDPALSCAEALRDLLDANGLRSSKESVASCTFYVSDDPEKFRSLGEIFLQTPIERVLNTYS
jgi:glutamate racemase